MSPEGSDESPLPLPGRAPGDDVTSAIPAPGAPADEVTAPSGGRPVGDPTAVAPLPLPPPPAPAGAASPTPLVPPSWPGTDAGVADVAQPLPPAPPAAAPWTPAPPSAGAPLGVDGGSLPPQGPGEAPRSSRSPMTKVVAVVVAVALLAAGFGVGIALGSDDDGGTRAENASGTVQQTALATDRPTDAPVAEDAVEPTAAVAEAVAPAVVQVETGDGLGAGVIYDGDGYVLTNAHVVGDASEVSVILADGSRFDGEVLGADRARDVAVVSFDPGDLELPVAVLAIDEDVQVGQLAVAVGSPFGLAQTVTAGIISAVGRPQPGPNNELVVGMLQTDAPINSGNSGGALADRRGRIIGINTSITSRSGDNTGIGFAIPISVAARVADSIVAGDVPAATFLGVRGPEDGSGPDDGAAGALIGEVTAGSAADGLLEEGDVIVTIEGHPVRTFEALAGFIGSHLPGDEVELGVLRDGERIAVTVVLGERDEALIS